jgi:pimeloyl-ACP methyl ester carboxylesterase
MSSWQSDDVTANGIRIHYNRTGGAKPTLVLFHGFSDNGLCWTPLARQLEAEQDIILPDLRAHGLSEAPAQGYTLDDLVQDALGLLDALHLQSTAVGGHSLGAMVAAGLAAQAPERVSRLVLEDPGWVDPSVFVQSKDTIQAAQSQFEVLVHMQEMPLDQVIAAGKQANPAWSDDELLPWAQSKQQISPSALNFLSALTASAPEPWQDVARRLAMPTLLITGDNARGSIVTPQIAAEAVALNPRIRVVHLAGAGHNIRREAFEPYVQAVREFLAEGE